MIVIKIENKEFNFIMIAFFACLSFITWVLKIPEVYNILLYSLILIGLALLKYNNMTLVVFSLFTIAANNKASFLELLYTQTLKHLHLHILVISKYFNFLYSGVFIVLIVILLIRFFKNKYKLNSKLLIPLALVLLYGLITIIWAPNKASAINEFWFIIQGYFIYAVISNDQDEKIDFNKLAWVLGLLLLVISLQYFVSYYEFFKLKEADITFINFWRHQNKAPINLWANPNIVAGVFGIAFLPSLYKYIGTNSKYKYLFIPFDLLIIYAIILTKTTGLHYAFGIGYIFIPFLLIKDKKILYITLVSGILIFILSMTLIVSYQEQVPNIYKFLNEKSTLRLDIYKEALNSINNVWALIFGRGLGYDRAILKASFFHSWFYQILVTRGIIGISLTFYIIYLIVGIISESNNKFKYFLLLGIIIYQAHALTDSGFDYQYIGVIHYLLIANLEKSNEMELNLTL